MELFLGAALIVLIVVAVVVIRRQRVASSVYEQVSNSIWKISGHPYTNNPRGALFLMNHPWCRLELQVQPKSIPQADGSHKSIMTVMINKLKVAGPLKSQLPDLLHTIERASQESRDVGAIGIWLEEDDPLQEKLFGYKYYHTVAAHACYFRML